MPDLKQDRLQALRKWEFQIEYHYDKIQYLDWAFDTLIIQYGALLQNKVENWDKKLELLKNNPDHKERVLSLLDVVRPLVVTEDTPDWRSALEENVRILEEKDKQEETEKKALARALLSQKHPHQEAQKIISQIEVAVQQAGKNLETELPPVITSDLIVTPPDTLSHIAHAAVSTATKTNPSYTLADASISLIPLVPPLVPLDPVIDYVHTTTSSYLSKLPPIAQQDIASATTILKFSHPTLSSNNISALFQQMQPLEEAKAGKAIDFPPEVPDLIANIEIHTSGNARLTHLLATAFLKNTGVSPSSAQTAAIALVKQGIPQIAYLLASYSPPSPKPLETEHSRNHIFRELQRVGLSFIQDQSPLDRFLFQALYTAPSLDYTQVYAHLQNDRGPTSSSSSSLSKNPFLRFLFDQGSSQIQDEIVSTAWQKFSTSALGQSLGLGAKAAVTTGTEAAAVGATTATGTGLTATVSGFLASLGIADPEPITKVIVLAAAMLAAKAKDILSWAKRNFRPIAIATGAAIGLLVFGPVGAVLGAVGGFVIASPIVSLSATANSIGTGITSASTAMVGLVATEIATPIIVIALSVPIVIALFLFIINTSALVVPVNLYGSPGIGNIINPPMGPGGNYPSCWPTHGKITQGPYCSTGNSSHCSYRSNAVDIANTLGEPIYATHDGTAYPLVYPADADFGGWGIYVEVRSPLGFRTVYGHLSESIDKIMDVKSGTQIGAMGRTGWVIGIPGIHSHYELMSLAGGPPPYTMPPPNSPKGLVPTYQLGGSTEGCFANESGGSANVVK